MTNICLIDDDQNILASLSLTLKSEGYNIKTFSDVCQVLRPCKRIIMILQFWTLKCLD